MRDNKNTINDLKNAVKIFYDERGWKKFHTPRNLATSIVLEASELLELFQWDLKTFSSVKTRKDDNKMEELWKEMADIQIYLIALANSLGIDLSKSVSEKLKLSAIKYPVKHFNKNGQDLTYYKKIKAKYRAGKK